MSQYYGVHASAKIGRTNPCPYLEPGDLLLEYACDGLLCTCTGDVRLFSRAGAPRFSGEHSELKEVNEMKTPRFTAEVAVHQRAREYRSTTSVGGTDELESTDTVSLQLQIGGGGIGGGGSSCSLPPLHCPGPAANRAVYPGCRVQCGPGETASCWSGDCFLHLAPICGCVGSYRPPGLFAW